MNQLKFFLQKEVNSSYKYIAMCLACMDIAKDCVKILNLNKKDLNYENNFYIMETTLENLIEKLEVYLKIKSE